MTNQTKQKRKSLKRVLLYVLLAMVLVGGSLTIIGIGSYLYLTSLVMATFSGGSPAAHLQTSTVNQIFAAVPSHLYQQGDAPQVIRIQCYFVEGSWCYFVEPNKIDELDEVYLPTIETKENQIEEWLAWQILEEIGLKRIDKFPNNSFAVQCTQTTYTVGWPTCQINPGHKWYPLKVWVLFRLLVPNLEIGNGLTGETLFRIRGNRGSAAIASPNKVWERGKRDVFLRAG